MDHRKHASLHCISSGAPTQKEIEVDLLQSKTQGKKEFQQFQKERMVSKTTMFSEPIKREIIKTFKSLEVTYKTTTAANSKGKHTRVQPNIFSQLLIIAKKDP